MLALILALMVLLTAVCAHKAAPLAKDRLNPRLTKVSVINNRQIQLTFTEEIDTLTLFPDSVFIRSEDETLTALLMYPSLSASEIIIATEPMKAVSYEINGLVLDKAENRGPFSSTFQGSVKPDTIAPWVTAYSEGEDKHEFFLQFSEAMDTMSASFVIVPRRDFIAEWASHRHARFIPATGNETLSYDTTYYIFLKSARDISGNKSIPFITSVTPDTVYNRVSLAGRALTDDVPVKTGLAILVRDHPIGISFVTDGNFSFSVRDSMPYTIQVIAGKHSGSGIAIAGNDNMISLKEEVLEIDSLID